MQATGFPKSKKALPYGNAFAFGKQMVNVVSWSGKLCT